MMWMDKIRCAVLAVQTDIGIRYVALSLPARVRLAWTFRHFDVLPEQVLSDGERAFIAALLAGNNFVPRPAASSCIGIIERTSPLPLRKPLSSVGGREAVSPARISG
jgi:hypothetical protein